MAHSVRRTFTTLRYLAKANSYMDMNSSNLPKMFLPPVNHSMRELDRSFFSKKILTSAATVFDRQHISPVKKALEKTGECLNLATIPTIIDDPDFPEAKRVILYPSVKFEDPNTWSAVLKALLDEKVIKLHPHELLLTYKDWTMSNILEATLPDLPPEEKETPAGFSITGHVAHVNLKEQYIPFRYLIGQVLLDKNPNVRTVINKLQEVGTESEYRTFPYEILAGPDDLNVTTSESDCEFKFNFAKVYWNSRLQTEHLRILNKFEPGEAICDAMAGVGPFSIPAAKRHVFVFANDLNPDSFEGLIWAAKKNKVTDFIAPSCMDGRAFIRASTKALAEKSRTVKVAKKTPRNYTSAAKLSYTTPRVTSLTQPPTFDHYIMNLPKTAVEFLDAFWGLFKGREGDFEPSTDRRLPMIHVYLFTQRHGIPSSQTPEEEVEVCETVSQHLGHTITPQTPDIELWYVRLVSPTKKYYCASFRLPPEVAFAKEERMPEVSAEHNYSQFP